MQVLIWRLHNFLHQFGKKCWRQPLPLCMHTAQVPPLLWSTGHESLVHNEIGLSQKNSRETTESGPGDSALGLFFYLYSKTKSFVDANMSRYKVSLSSRFLVFSRNFVQDRCAMLPRLNSEYVIGLVRLNPGVQEVLRFVQFGLWSRQGFSLYTHTMTWRVRNNFPKIQCFRGKYLKNITLLQ